MKADLFLTNWADIIGETEETNYIDYDALLQSDDEFLILSSLFEVDSDELFND